MIGNILWTVRGTCLGTISVFNFFLNIYIAVVGSIHCHCHYVCHWPTATTHHHDNDNTS